MILTYTIKCTFKLGERKLEGQQRSGKLNEMERLTDGQAKETKVSEIGCPTSHATIFQLYMCLHIDVQVD